MYQRTGPGSAASGQQGVSPRARLRRGQRTGRRGPPSCPVPPFPPRPGEAAAPARHPGTRPSEDARAPRGRGPHRSRLRVSRSARARPILETWESLQASRPPHTPAGLCGFTGGAPIPSAAYFCARSPARAAGVPRGPGTVYSAPGRTSSRPDPPPRNPARAPRVRDPPPRPFRDHAPSRRHAPSEPVGEALASGAFALQFPSSPSALPFVVYVDISQKDRCRLKK